MHTIVRRHLGKVVAGAAVAVAGTAVMVAITLPGTAGADEPQSGSAGAARQAGADGAVRPGVVEQAPAQGDQGKGSDPLTDDEIERAEHGTVSLNPWYFRNDYLGLEQWSRNIVCGRYVELAALHGQHRLFAETWDNNLRLQGFSGAFTDKCILG